ncbi:MAG: hypothetical protein KY395_06705 [Actinobacteria bacterium]|nr:hypothetical protein [Actinomycetota bacterium]
MEQGQTTIAGALIALVVFGLPCVYALFRPAPVWRLRFLFSRWTYRGGEPPEPSTAGLAVVRVVATVFLLLLGGALLQAIDRGEWSADRRLQEDEATTTTAFTETPSAPAGLQCSTDDLIVTVQSDFTGRADGSIDLGQNPAASAEEAVAEYRQARFPGLSGQAARRSDSEFVFHDENDRVSLVIQAANAPEGWYVPLYHACQSFEAAAMQPPGGA